ncbi:MAG: hypothetical protein SH847_06475 [Roseiflexaceae bacterium]|nr:hypothetical protein [Roseiflexaceae bacterium]
MQRSESGMPFVVVGVVVALILIVVTFQSRPPNETILQRQFAPQPIDPSQPTLAPFELPQVSLPDVPPDVRTTISDLTQQLASGKSVPALTPTMAGPSVQITIQGLSRSGDTISVRGQVTNISKQRLTIAPEAFLFRDSTGISYATEGSNPATLQPGEQTSFDLSVPLPEGRGLTLILTVPPDPPIEQTLMVELR